MLADRPMAALRMSKRRPRTSFPLEIPPADDSTVVLFIL
jgi:hypothetical protein